VSGIKAAKFQLTPQWKHVLSDYVTVVAYAPTGDGAAAATASGTVVFFADDGAPETLQTDTGQATSGFTFSADARFCAWGGQSGEVRVFDRHQGRMIDQQSHGPAWIDAIAWHPSSPLLAYGVGSTVHVWDAQESAAIARLDFVASSVLHLAWHPLGDFLAVSGHGGVKVWSVQDWSSQPQRIDVPGASLYCDWSAEGRYLGSGNLDRTLTVAEWGSPPPWLMQGFPGKVRQISWSMPTTDSGSPLIAAACAEGITVWERSQKSTAGWQSRVLQHHRDRVNGIAFQPHTLTLASAGQDGRIALWRNGRQLDQSQKVFGAGVSCLLWSPDGTRLLAGGNAGEVGLWRLSRRGQGFS
jgi:WD40 repeat protein